MCAPSNAPRDVVHYVTTGLGMPVRWSQPRGALCGCLKHGRLGSAWIRGDAGAAGARLAYWGQARTMRRSSVMSSIAQRRPSRPSPESFTPPYGM